MAERKENIVMFPFMAQGHIIPFLALAIHMQQRKNCTITFVNTPLNIKKLTSSLPPTSSIRLVEIPFCSSDHGLPPDTENTDAIPYHLVIRLLEASVSLRPSFKKLIQGLIEEQHGQRPLCIIADIFFGWTASVAKELNVFHAIFSGASGFGLACYYSLWMNLPHRKVINSDAFPLPDFPEASSIHITQLATNIREGDGADAWSIFQKENFSGWLKSDGILFNTVEELDDVGLLYFRRKIGRPAWPIGPVLLPMESRERVGKGGIEWLSTKPVNSVLFVSFGSMNTISASQMMNLAMGLEASGKNFIWVTGKEMRRKASQAMEMIKTAMKDEKGGKGSSVKAMDDFFSAALSMREKSEKEHCCEIQAERIW
ncbi:hypothetical protein FH972_009706 [Carpinus fangiana]|uniref:Glycosyltransferase N-terminal domain-containing protein n=1 Tax=Carpinus fangiana TaxID=176857 RepID=A0A660KL38_9ROSI|nr:hypothetical protein FH972_009706 [Carpinus fangiana]